MSWFKGAVSLASIAAKRRVKPMNTIVRSAVPRRAPRVIETQTQQSGPTRSSIIQEILSQNQSPGSKVTFGAAMLLGATMLITPFKEGSPARVILTSTEALVRQRKSQRAPAMLKNWLKASYVWIVIHVWTLLLAIATWKFARS
ncbi:uncharacterized protein M437DRAFT_84776 [Aureobasidium melanogenum CBS 110374]|uniref:Uncharacterized protein n=1 Tax=Aureobasidium melanogenum (strain CBS 110374) TaxID=1043003 RepID=A0A074VXJ5_AURM1|nr:uncharacterized protein M437DRAFT_84776 [Aureobasidium melanogenum CBS 110374]KEQ62437.1 hypothetical protein M437DRAFT_84776 [Aureobasidium melanogenum CBS 110374]